MRSSIQRVVHSGRRSVVSVLAILGTISACSGSDPSKAQEIGDESQAVTEDGLAQAYQTFRSLVLGPGPEQTLVLGAGHHPILSTETLKANGLTAGAIVKFSLDGQGNIVQVDGILNGIPRLSESFDLWLVKNDKVGGTSKPESGDTMTRIGSFSTVDTTLEQKTMSVTSFKQPNGSMGPTLRFDPDVVVVTRGGKDPLQSRVLVGNRTILEKRAWREQMGISMDDFSGTTQANFVETNDPLVKRGAQLFFNEQFGGNGRTCGTCHRLNDNLTITPKLIATLPQSDPLFVHENNAALAQLENKTLLRQRALFTENVDGFDKTGMLRSANHTFALVTTIDANGGPGGRYPADPPRHQTGWGGDGAPGGGSLHEFAVGAIVQHLPKRLDRVAGTDFRIPTQQELDALEAFQLFTGRQKQVSPMALKFKDTTVQRGQTLAISQTTGGKCASCHFELFGITVNENFDIGTRARMTDIPTDDGFRQPLTRTIPQLPDEQAMQSPLVPGVGLMNIPPLVEAADTGPFFHNNSAQTIEDVVDHYTSANFTNSRDAHLVGGSIVLTPMEKDDIANFLRELNAVENIRQVRKRANFVKLNRSSGNGTILDVAIRDVQDAIDDLAPKNLNVAARNALATVKQALVQAKGQPDANRPAYVATALTWLQVAKDAILSADPNGDF